jgi:uncharacterized protein (TIGR02217 family)
VATLPSFPELKGLGWSVYKRPLFSTRIAKHVSGREIRVPLFSVSLYEFELTFEGLDSNGTFPGVGVNSLQKLLGLFTQCQGSHGTFLYIDPSDNFAHEQTLGVGDGSQKIFTFERTIGGTVEPVSYVTSVSNVYLDGVDQTSGWSFTVPRTLSFVSAPGVGVSITATFAFAFECRFLEDQIDFENFMKGLWKVERVKFRSVKS